MARRRGARQGKGERVHFGDDVGLDFGLVLVWSVSLGMDKSPGVAKVRSGPHLGLVEPCGAVTSFWAVSTLLEEKGNPEDEPDHVTSGQMCPCLGCSLSLSPGAAAVLGLMELPRSPSQIPSRA